MVAEHEGDGSFYTRSKNYAISPHEESAKMRENACRLKLCLVSPLLCEIYI